MKTTNNMGWVIAGLGCLLLLGTAWAQDESVTGYRLGPGLRLEPTLGARVWVTDNLYLTAADETRATALLIDPALALAYTASSGDYRLGYRGQAGRFNTVDEDNYFDHEAYLTGDVRALARHRFEYDARYKHGHDFFGSNRTQGLSGGEDREMDIWNESGVAGKYTFGHTDATLNLYARAGVVDKEYTSNRVDPGNPASGTRFLDFRSTLVGGGVLYRIAPRTRMVLDLEHQDIDYDLDASPSFDGEVERALIGVRWLATAKTTGEVLVGHYARNFDASARSDVSGFDWQARVNWMPRVRTQLSVTTGRLIRETFLLGENFINEEYLKLGWRQDWTQRLYSDIALNYYGDTFEGTPRDDDSVGAAATAYYRLSRRVTLKGGVEHAERDSSADTLDFERNITFLGFDALF